VNEGVACVAESWLGIELYDVSIPARPSFLGSYDTPGDANNVVISDGYIYISDYSSYIILTTEETRVEQDTSNRTGNMLFLGNSPNPFNNRTSIEYSIPVTCAVRMELYDLLGRSIAVPVNNVMRAGYHRVIWDASNYPSGIYFCRIQAGKYVETMKMLLLK
jgi:hypothetical protein